MKTRQEKEKFLLDFIYKLAGDSNLQLYKQFLASMNDKQFHDWLLDLKNRRKFLSVIDPVFIGSKITIENNFKLADELGCKFFQKVWIGSNDGSPMTLTNYPLLVMWLPTRRASQLQTKKLSVSTHAKSKDILTGQPTGESATARVSYPEGQMLAALGLEKSFVEFMKYRGGDNQGFLAMNAMISRYGTVRQETLKPYASGVTSTKTLKTFLTCMHIASTL